MNVPTILMAAAVAVDPGGNAGSAADTPAEAARSARPPQNRNEFPVELLVAWGAGWKVDDSTLNRYGLGFGARGGVTLGGPRMYFGASFVRFLGDETEGSKVYTVTLDAEIGYELGLAGKLLFLRPMAALGVAQPVTIQPDNEGYPLAFHVAPGLLAGVRVAPLLVSLEVRQDFVASDAGNATSLALGCGAVF